MLISILQRRIPCRSYLAAMPAGARSAPSTACSSTVLRIQPIVATLGSYLILSGLTPRDHAGADRHRARLDQGFPARPRSSLDVPLVAWLSPGSVPRPTTTGLMATGGDDRARLHGGRAGHTGALHRLCASPGGLAGIAGLMLTALIGSADPTIGTTYTLIAISSVALGGVSLAGGAAALLGPPSARSTSSCCRARSPIFNVSTFVLQIAYGAILAGAVSLSAVALRPPAGEGAHERLGLDATNGRVLGAYLIVAAAVRRRHDR